MEHKLAAKTVALVANSTVTLTWSGVDFYKAFPESVIRPDVSMRLSCTSTCANAVYVGVRYQTLEKVYQVAERKTISYIPPGASVEITPSSVPALGLLNGNIINISVDLTAPATGNATITLIIDDEPPPLSSTPPDAFGLDAKFAYDYLNIGITTPVAVTAATSPQTGTIYTVPAGKRFLFDAGVIYTDATPTWPDMIAAFMNFNYPAFTLPFVVYSSNHGNIVSTVTPNADLSPLPGGQTISYQVTSIDPNARVVSFVVFGREVF